MGKYGLAEIFLSLSDANSGKERFFKELRTEGFRLAEGFHKERIDLVISDEEEVLEEGRKRGSVLIGVSKEEGKGPPLNADLVVFGLENLDVQTIYMTWCHKRGLPFVIGENDTLLVRELTRKDVKPYMEVTREEHVLAFLPDGRLGEAEQEARLTSYIKQIYAFYGYGIYGVFLKEENELIGAVSLDVREWKHQPEYEIGFFLSHCYLGKGYAIMAVEFLLEFAFCYLEAERLISITASSNVYAKNLLKKLGFRLEEEACFLLSNLTYQKMKRCKEKDMEKRKDESLVKKNQEGRGAGILLSISSLPSKYGIGCFSKEAYDFIDALEAAGQKFWQLLPLGPTSYGDSPYQSFSTFAGNPYFIDPTTLVAKKWLTEEVCESYDFGSDSTKVDYEKMYHARFKLLIGAFQKSKIEENEDFLAFVEENRDWLNDYALFMAIKDAKGGISWTEWEENLRLRKAETLEEYREKFATEILFYQFLQFEFYKEWMDVKAYANEKGISIIGDLPIYVALDSSDTWANPELFKLDEDMAPVVVAGCPPDAFSAEGQLWGNPIYDWAYHAKTGYEWWLKRIKHCLTLYDVVRIDHFRGFDEYYEIPFPAENAKKGEWEAGPGLSLFTKAKEELQDLNIIAEDLGFLTDSVLELVENTGFPGMKVLQFAFDAREESDYLPHNYQKNSFVYTGTHDNDTTVSWYDSISKEDRTYLHEYLNLSEKATPAEVTWELIRLSYASVSRVAIIPMQDVLQLDGRARMNRPSTLGGNWEWRMEKESFTKEVEKKLAELVRIYRR